MNAMQRIADGAVRIYNRLVLDRPLLVILCLVAAIGFLGYKARNFKIDASAETLLLENDAALRYTRQINDRYGLNDFLIVAYTPKTGDLLDGANLAHLKKLQDELAGIKDVASVMSLLDVPLLESPPINYNEFSGSLPTLQSPGTDKKLARAELQNSPLYRDLIVSDDMKTTALIVNLKIDEVYRDLLHERTTLQDLESQRPLTETEENRLADIQAKIDRHLDVTRIAQHENIRAVRAVLAQFNADAALYLGGNPAGRVQDFHPARIR